MQDHDSARREEFRAVREAHFSTHERMNIENWKRYANEMGPQPETMTQEQATAPMQRPRALRVRVAVAIAGVALVCIAYILVKSKSSPDREKNFVQADQLSQASGSSCELEPPMAIMPRTH
ncbi:hypothetical protein AAVH_01476 [Aphelenchoides avenae]|nr:hypothetical protein AAVH_01476 [Aphelenchus avenae]